MTRGALILALIGAGTLVAAQVPTSPPAPAFEVASVKPNVSGDQRSTYSGPPGSMIFTNMELRNLIIEAYGIRANVARFLMTGGNERILRTRFDVNAKAPVDTPRAEQRLMLRTLLADRFNLRTHTESRQVPVYALTVAREARLGPQLRQSSLNCLAYMAAARKSGVNPFTDPAAPRDGNGQAWCPMRIDFGQAGALTVRGAGVVGDLVGLVQGFVDRPILDRTGLDGYFEVVATFSSSQDPRVDSSAASIFTAFQEQLGLKLEPRSAPMEILEIDSVEMPTPD